MAHDERAVTWLQAVPLNHGFVLTVRPPALRSQWMFFIGALIPLAIAWTMTDHFMHGSFTVNDRPAEPWEFVYILPFWIGGLALVAAGLHRAFRKVVFTADAGTLVIGTKGPLWRKMRVYPRESLQAAIVGDSSTQVNGKCLLQLKLYFAGQNAPLTMLTGRDESVLTSVARHLTETLDLGKNSYRPTQYMQVRHAPLNSGVFKLAIGIGMGVGTGLFLLHNVIGPIATFIGFLILGGTVLIPLLMTRKARCPKCGDLIRRDQLSPEGCHQYTCANCRIVWQTPWAAGGPDS